MTFPQLSEQDRISRLQAPAGKARMVLDTDTYNEIDDQFALTYALLSPDKLSVEAIYAAPFHNSRSNGPGDGMEKSYEEILRLLEFLDGQRMASPIVDLLSSWGLSGSRKITPPSAI